ncbi:phage tail spike protein [Halobacillus litoralis]|uniref:phage tail spike protein n=1 Tax=Halobacillus litoralis TaxID=45668 RepID=UPI001CD302B0|nr:phage tail spike protein [Halobacillus litoralis]MCA1021786.1 hypothetical protein [Halobacillus litoralis]
MAQTQLASLQIGTVDTPQRKKDKSPETVVHIFDHKTDQLLDYFGEKEYWADERVRQLKDQQDTWDFETFSDKTFSQYLRDRNRLLFRNKNGKGFSEFIVEENKPYLDVEGSRKLIVYTSASYVEIKKQKIIDPQETGALSAEQHVTAAVSGTKWKKGRVDFEGVRSFTFEEHTNPLEYLRKVSSEFGLELHFRVETDGMKVTGRYVDLLEHTGASRGYEATIGHNLQGVERHENKRKIVTALVGVSPADEEGNRKTVFVSDEEALQRWGDKGNHLVEAYYPESTDQDMTIETLTTLTKNELDKRINSTITYSAQIAVLAKQAGVQEVELHFGDTISLRDEKFSPPLYLTARIYVMKESVKHNGPINVELGEYIEYSQEKVFSMWRQLQKEVVQKVSDDKLKDYAEPKKVRSSTPPEDKKVIWINTSGDEDVWFTYDFESYKWKPGPSGPQGIPGPPGEDGQSLYTWIKFADTIEGDGMADDPAGKKYIGLSYNQSSPNESYDSALYQWSQLTGNQGVQGPPGEDGRPTYTWIKYGDNSQGSGITDDPTGKEFIGIAYNRSTPTESGIPQDYKWSKVKGEKGDQGPRGPQGVQGPVGEDGLSLYTWIKYADTAAGGGMSDNPVGKEYIGISYNQTSQTESSNSDLYTWTKIVGETGVEGPPGDDGQSLYTWIKYADTETGSGISDKPTGKKYIGIAYNKTTVAESTSPAAYQWSKMEGPQGEKGDKGNKGSKGDQGDRGIQGPPGEDGQTTYTWVKYAGDASGGGMSNYPSGKEYIGFAYNKTTPTESNNAADYTWAKIKGDQGNQGPQGPEGDKGDTGARGPEGDRGPQGIQGPKGDDGTPTYTWIRYADTSTGGGMSNFPDGKKYIGIASNKSTPTEGANPSDYTWALFEGPKGDKGNTGVQGPTGSEGPRGPQGPNLVNSGTSFGEEFRMISGNYYYYEYISAQESGAWFRIAQNKGDRAFGRFMLKDVTSGIHQTVMFEASIHYGGNPFIAVSSSSKYSSSRAAFTAIRILSKETYDPVYLEVFVPDNGRDLNLHLYLTDNIQDSGWEAIDWMPQSNAPSGYTSYSRGCEPGETVQDFADSAKGSTDLWKHPHSSYIDGGKIYANSVTANQISVSQLSALAADLGDVTAGNLTTDTFINVGTNLGVGDTLFIGQPGDTTNSKKIIFEPEQPIDAKGQPNIYGHHIEANGPGGQGTLDIGNTTQIFSPGKIILYSDRTEFGAFSDGIWTESDMIGYADAIMKFSDANVSYDGASYGGYFKFENDGSDSSSLLSAGGMRLDKMIHFTEGAYIDPASGHLRLYRDGGKDAIKILNDKIYFHMNDGGSKIQFEYLANDHGHRMIDFGSLKLKALASGSQIQIRNGNDTGYTQVTASDFVTASKKEYKMNIHPYEKKVLDSIKQWGIYTYTLKDYDQHYSGAISDRYHLGHMFDEVPSLLQRGDGIDLYALSAYQTKALQELISIIEVNDQRMNTLEQENDELKMKLNNQEQRLQKLESLLLSAE